MLSENANAKEGMAVNDYYPAYYKEDGTLVPAVNMPGGAEAINELKTAVSSRTTYYNLQGVRISRPHHGICIEVTTHPDGTKAARKILTD